MRGDDESLPSVIIKFVATMCVLKLTYAIVFIITPADYARYSCEVFSKEDEEAIVKRLLLLCR